MFKCSVTQGNFKTQEDDAGLHKGSAFPLWHKALTIENSDNVTLYTLLQHDTKTWQWREKAWSETSGFDHWG